MTYPPDPDDELWELADDLDPGEEWELGDAGLGGQRSVTSDTQSRVPAGTP